LQFINCQDPNLEYNILAIKDM